MKITEILTDIGRPVAFHPGLKRITGSTTATLFLCQLIYWTGKQADPEGWIYKTSTEVEDETGLTYYEQNTARKRLVEMGFIEEHYKRLDHQMVFRIMANAIDAAWRMRHDLTAEPDNTRLGNAASPDSFNSSTETTPQITTENTQREEPAAAAPPLPVFSTSPSIQAERTWQKVTNQATMPSTIRNDATEMILGLSMRYAWGEELCGYLTPYWEAWCNHKTKDGRPYSRTSAGWLEWAVAGQIPPESKKNGSGSKDPNNLPPVEEDPAERAKIDAIFANRSKNK